MSYTNGVGGAQQLLNTTDFVAANKTTAAAKTDAAATAAPSGASANGGVASDQASFSTTGALLVQALSGSDVRSSKVEALQQSIAAGTYNVSSSDVADKLIESLQK